MSDPDLGPLFRSSGAPTGQLDADAIIKKSRRRRLPRLVVVTAVPILAAVAVLGGGVVGLAQLTGSSFSSSSSGSSVSADAPARGVAPSAEAVPLQRDSLAQTCGEPIANAGAASSGLVASSTFPNPQAATAPAATTITNSGTKAVSGTAGTPSVIFERDGVIVAQTELSDDVGHRLQLTPGASLTLDAALPTLCKGISLSGVFTVVTIVPITLSDGTDESISGPATKVDFGK